MTIPGGIGFAISICIVTDLENKDGVGGKGDCCNLSWLFWVVLLWRYLVICRVVTNIRRRCRTPLPPFCKRIPRSFQVSFLVGNTLKHLCHRFDAAHSFANSKLNGVKVSLISAGASKWRIIHDELPSKPIKLPQVKRLETSQGALKRLTSQKKNVSILNMTLRRRVYRLIVEANG